MNNVHIQVKVQTKVLHKGPPDTDWSICDEGTPGKGYSCAHWPHRTERRRVYESPWKELTPEDEEKVMTTTSEPTTRRITQQVKQRTDDLSTEVDILRHRLQQVREVCGIVIGEGKIEGTPRAAVLGVLAVAKEHARNLDSGSPKGRLMTRLGEFERSLYFYASQEVTRRKDPDQRGVIVGIDGEEVCVRWDDTVRTWVPEHELMHVVKDEETEATA